MRITTKIQWDSLDDFLTNRPPRVHEYVDYDGPVVLLKKGRETQEKIGDTALRNAGEDRSIQQGARAQADPFAASLMATKPGELSPYAKEQYGSQVRNINDTYGNNLRTGFKALAYRGMGGPTGEMASVLNTAGRNRDFATTEAYNQAMQNTYGQGLQGLNYFAGQQQLYDPNRALGTSSEAAYRRGQMGSTMGDIGAGVSTGAQAALAGAAICWIAEKLYGLTDRRTLLMRKWLNDIWAKESRIGRLTMFAYRHIGRAVAALYPVREMLRPVFDAGLRRAEAWRYENCALGGV